MQNDGHDNKRGPQMLRTKMYMLYRNNTRQGYIQINPDREEFSHKVSSDRLIFVSYIPNTALVQLVYTGRMIQKLHIQMNKHRSNRKNKFMLHSISRHCTLEHPEKNSLRSNNNHAKFL